MRSGARRSYNVIPGEPALGRQIEQTHTIEYDDIFDAYIEAWLEGPIEDSSEAIDICGFDTTVGEFLDNDDIGYINDTLEQELLDDDYGTKKHFTLLEASLDSVLDKDVEIEYDTMEMI